MTLDELRANLAEYAAMIERSEEMLAGVDDARMVVTIADHLADLRAEHARLIAAIVRVVGSEQPGP